MPANALGQPGSRAPGRLLRTADFATSRSGNRSIQFARVRFHCYDGFMTCGLQSPHRRSNPIGAVRVAPNSIKNVTSAEPASGQNPNDGGACITDYVYDDGYASFFANRDFPGGCLTLHSGSVAE